MEKGREKGEEKGGSLPNPLTLSLSQPNILPLLAPAMQVTAEGSILP